MILRIPSWYPRTAVIRAPFAIVLLLASLLATPTTLPAPAGQTADTAFVWVQQGPAGTAIARVITTRASCPPITLDGVVQPMQVRAPQAPPDFPVLDCETTIPAGTTAAAVNGRSLPLPKARLQRIVVIGDTGCRLKDGSPVQACNDAKAWPFAQVAERAASWQPDLVIHVGDLLYREAPRWWP